jgi:hypothetical protein
MLRGRNCRPGDIVRLLHETGEGVVIRNTPEFLYVDTGDGFELPVLHHDVIVMKQAELVSEHENIAEKLAEPIQTKEPAESLNHPVKKEIRKKGVDLIKGIYLAFSPVNQDTLMAGDIRVYLINYTRLNVFYMLYLAESGRTEPHYSGNIEAASAFLIDTIERKKTSLFRRGMFQCLFTSASEKGIPAPYYAHLDVRPERFLKDELYSFNQFISMKCINVQLMRFEEVNWIQNLMMKDAPMKDLEASFSKVIEDQGLIGKHKTAPFEAEVDLHIESIVQHHEHLEDGMKLKKQLDLFRACLDSAIEHKYRKVIFIHGVGVGILKLEIHKILRTYEHVQFRDAPIARYGIGATEVLISQ